MTIQEQIEKWKKEQTASETVTSPKQIPTLMYQAQNDANRSYDHNSALERQNAIAQIQAQTQAINSQAQAIADVQQAKANVENIIGGSINQIPSLAEYVSQQPAKTPFEVPDFEAQKAQNELIDKWLSPNYRMTKEEEKQAEKVALEGLKKFRGMSKSQLTPSELEELYKYKALQTKTSEIQSAAIGALDSTMRMGRGLDSIARKGYLGPVMQGASKLISPATDKISSLYDEYATDAVNDVSTQNPIATGTGRFIANAAAYGATNPAFDALGASLGAKGAAAFGLNQLAQAGQDVALDIVPTYEEMARDGEVTDAEIQELAKQFGWDVVGNLAIGVGGELVKKVANARQAAKATKAANQAVAQSVSEGAERLAKLNETGYQPPSKLQADEIAALNTNPVEANNNQFNALMDQFNGQFKDESAMRNIYNPEDLDNVLNNQLRQAMNDYRVPEMENPRVDMELPVLEQSKNMPSNSEIKGLNDELSNMWGNSPKTAEKVVESAQNVAKEELPAEVQEKLMSDAEEIWGSINKAKNAAEATNDPKAIAAYERLRDAFTKYEDTAWNGDNEAINSARKATDAARQNFIRTMKKIDPNYKGDLTGTKLGNLGYRVTSMQPDAKANQELADSIIEAEKDLGKNTHVQDAVPETKSPFKGIETKKTDISPFDNKANGYTYAPRADGIDYTKLPGYEYRYTEGVVDADGNYIRKPRENADTQWFKSAPERTTPYTAEELREIQDFADNRNKLTGRERWEQHDLIQGKYPELFVGDAFKGVPKNAAETVTNAAKTQQIDPKSLKDADDLVMAEDVGLNPKTDIEEPKFKIEEIDESKAPKSSGEVLTDSTEVKERGQSKHLRGEGKMQMEGVSDEVAADFKENPDLYATLKNKDTKAKAERVYVDSDNPEREFRDMLAKKDPAALPLGHQLAKDYSAMGDHKAAAQIYRDMGQALTESGQFSQAAVINMVKNDPLTALEYATKEIDKLNQAGAQRFGNKWKDFELSSDEIKAFNNIKPGDADGIKDVFDMIGSRLGKEYPTTFMEKLIEARRVAMLFNPRTNVRNLLANPPTLAMRWVSDRVEALGQNAAHLINPNVKVTQSITGSGANGRKIAKEVFNGDQVQAMLKGSGSKSELPELKNSVMTRKQVFKGTPVSKLIDKWTNNGIQKANEKLFGVKGVQSIAETLRNATYKALDLGDSPFVKENFIERLGSYIKAQGIKSAADVPDEAIELAWEEAMKATYKDNSWAVGMLRDMKKSIEKADNVIPGLGTSISQSAIPFVQAPGNIAARMVDYSPVGATKGLADIVSGAKNGNAKAVEKGIEEAAKGLSGTGLILLGMKLKESGVLTGTYSDNDRKRAFEKQNGFKEFAIHAGNNYFTYGWAQPFAQTLMVGTLLQDAIEKSDEYDSEILKALGIEGSGVGKAIGVAREGARAGVNSWFNESPISGLAEFFKGNSYSDTDIAGNIWKNGVQNFGGALIPAVVNATAKAVDPVQRNTTDSTSEFKTFINSNVAKIPGLSKTLPAKYDNWGREMKYAETKGGAAAAKFLIPGDYSYDKSDDIDKEITRLFDATGANTVFPPTAEKSVDGNKLDNKQYSEYQKDIGQRNRQLAEAFINSDMYKELPDAERAEIINKLYSMSNAITKRDKFDHPVADSSSYKQAIAAYDEAGGGEKGAEAAINVFAGKKLVADSGISATSNAAKEIKEAAASGDLDKAQQIADNKAKTDEILKKYDIKANSTAGKEIAAKIEAGKPRDAEMIAKRAQAEKEEAAKKEETKEDLTSYGLTKPGTTATYQKAQGEIPGLTTKQFADTYKKIDSNGNQGITQDEVIDYLNAYNVSESEANKIWSAYGSSNWKKIPVLKNGKWTKAKK